MAGKCERNRIAYLGIALFMCAYALGNVSSVAAGEMAIPMRTPKIQKGDWFLFRLNGELIKETAVEIEKTDDDLMVKYTIEKFDDNGTSQSTTEAAQFLSYEQEGVKETIGNQRVKRERKRVTVDGKAVDVVVVTFSGEVPYSLWYSDAISITGRVAMVSEYPGSDTYWSIKPLAFGGAGSPFDIKKYLGVK